MLLNNLGFSKNIMAKEATHPPLFNKLKTIEIKNLISSGYLTKYGYKRNVASWKTLGDITAKIGFAVQYGPDVVFLQLNYSYGGQPRSYRIALESKVSNLGKGTIWFFRCPKTGKLCRKLYLFDGWFVSRKAVPGMYEIQTYSKQARKEKRIFDACLYWNAVENELFKPNAKQTYRGKITRRTARFHKILNKLNKVTVADVLSVCHF